MGEFKGVKWSLGGISGRMIKTNQYTGYVADVDTKANALLISKAPEMLEMLIKLTSTMDYKNIEEAKQLIKESTTL